MRYFVSFLLLSLLLLPSCRPTAEESTTKISKAWQINKYYEDNNDLTSEFKTENKNYTLQFYPDLTFLQSAVVNDTFRTRSGNWAFNEEVDSVFLYGTEDTTRYFIRLLRAKNLNIRQVISTTTQDYLMVDY